MFGKSGSYRIFRKSIEEIQVSYKHDKNNEYFTWIPINIMFLSHSVILTTRNVSDKSRRENQNTHFMFDNFFLEKSYHLWDNVEKYCTAGQATDNNMAHEYCMMGYQILQNTFIIMWK